MPAALKGKEVTAVVTVADGSGDEVFHTLKIRVRRAASWRAPAV
jgi:hypothetical protein